MTLRQWRLLWPACLLAAALCPAFPRAQSPSDCVVAGTIASGATPLPGVVVTLAGADGQTVGITSTPPDGSYALRIRSAQAERLTLKAELVACAPVTREIGASCQQRVDLAMTLASRVPRTEANAPSAAATPLAARPVAGRSRGAQATAPQPFQSLELVADQAGLARPPADAGDANGANSRSEERRVGKECRSRW